MNEFIEKLIERLEEESKKRLDVFEKENRKGNYDRYSDGMIDAFDEAIDIVKSLAAEYNDGWIPCSERLPEVKKEVLILADDNAMFVGHLMNGGFSVHDGDGWIGLKHILVWQPLPKLYREKGEKE